MSTEARSPIWRLVLSPNVAVGAFVLIFLAWLYDAARERSLLYPLMSLAWFLLQLAWAYALFLLSPETRRWPAWALGGRGPFVVVVVSLAIVLLAEAIGLRTLATLSAVIGAVATLISLWVSARSLVTVEEGPDPHGNRTFVTLMALLYLPIGAYYLRRRVDALAG